MLKRLMVCLMWAFPVAAAGCAGGVPTSWNAATHTMCAGTECYALGPLGPGWRSVHQHDAEVGYFNAAVGGVIQSNATCRDDAEAAPLDSLTAHLLVGYTEQKIRSVTVLPFARREALRTVVDAKLDGVPVVLDLYVFKSNGCIFDLSYAAPAHSYERGVADFQIFIGGFSETHHPAST